MRCGSPLPQPIEAPKKAPVVPSEMCSAAKDFSAQLAVCASEVPFVDDSLHPLWELGAEPTHCIVYSIR